MRAYGDGQELTLVKEQVSGMFDDRPRQCLTRHVTWEMVLELVASVLHYNNIPIDLVNPRDVHLLAGQAGVVLADHPEGRLERWSYVTAAWMNWLQGDRSECFAPSEEGFAAWKEAGSTVPDPLDGPLDGDTEGDEYEREETEADVLAENMERIEGADFWLDCGSDDF